MSVFGFAARFFDVCFLDGRSLRVGVVLLDCGRLLLRSLRRGFLGSPG
jgi:hypothetical protein